MVGGLGKFSWRNSGLWKLPLFIWRVSIEKPGWIYLMWPQRVGLEPNFNSIQKNDFSKIKASQERTVECLSYIDWGILADVYMSVMFCRSTGGSCLNTNTASVGPQWSLISLAFLTSSQVMSTQWPLKSFPSLRLWFLWNRCMSPPMKTPFPLTLGVALLQPVVRRDLWETSQMKPKSPMNAR